MPRIANKPWDGPPHGGGGTGKAICLPSAKACGRMWVRISSAAAQHRDLEGRARRLIIAWA